MPAAEKQRIARMLERARQRLVNRVVREHGFELSGKVQQFLHQAAGLVLGQPPVGLAQVHRQNEQGGQLAGERLGGGDADLRTGVRIDACRRPRA